MNKKQSRAFEAFVESEGDRLLRIAVLMTSNHQLAEDAAQRTLERLAELESQAPGGVDGS